MTYQMMANQTKVIYYSCVLVSMILLVMTSICNATYMINVGRYGARSDGRRDSSKAFMKAWWAACGSNMGATIYIPRGTYLLNRPVEFSGPCKNKIVFHIDGKLVAPSNIWSLNSEYWIQFRKVNRVKIYGGTLDARGHAYWTCRRYGKSCPTGARSVSFSWCNNIVVSGLTSMDSKTIHMAIDHSHNFLIRDVRIRAPSGSPNTDGIHLQHSTGITITRSTIMTGDDCISIGQGSMNLWIERIACGPGHGISIGSLGDYANEAGVENVTVTNSVFTKTQNGVRIKSWARPSNGFVRNIAYRNLIMKNVQNPIIIDQNYCPGNSGCPHQSSGVKISQVTYNNIKGTSATPIAMNFECSQGNPCWGIRIQDIRLTYFKKPAKSYCRYVTGGATGVVIPSSCL